MNTSKNKIKTEHFSWLFPAVAIAFFLVFMFVLLGTPLLSGGINTAKDIENQYKLNQSIIDFANDNPTYIVPSGKITKIAYSSEYKKYYIEYSLQTVDGPILNNYTYAMFDKSQVTDLNIGDNIKVAVNSVPTTLSTKAIPLICDGALLNNNGQYLSAIHTKNIGIAFLIIAGALFLFTLWGFMMIYIIMQQTKRDGHYPGHIEVQEELSSTGIICSHCGANVPHYNTYCYNCGRKLKKKKDE